MKLINSILAFFSTNQIEEEASHPPKVDLQSVPRYPPFAEGLPSVSIEDLVASQDKLLKKIFVTVGFNKVEFDSMVLPVIENYARYVHLLPASDSHHHSGVGGLFRHGLEVGYWAAKTSEAIIFTKDDTPENKRKNEPKWRLACFIAGLLHDVGKPLSDVSIVDDTGHKDWNPYGESLFDWTRTNNIPRYFIRWNCQKHKNHDKYSLLIVNKLMTESSLSFLTETGKEILESMLQSISGVKIDESISKIVSNADKESVTRDLKRNRIDMDEYSQGVPVERYVLDAISRLIREKEWTVNQFGSKVWVLDCGVFLVWKLCTKEICQLLKKDNVPGIPQESDVLADILLERDFAVCNAVSDKIYRYWNVIPKPEQTDKEKFNYIPTLMLRIDKPETIFRGKSPTPICGEIINENEETSQPIEAQPVESDIDFIDQQKAFDDKLDAMQAHLPPIEYESNLQYDAQNIATGAGIPQTIEQCDDKHESNHDEVNFMNKEVERLLVEIFASTNAQHIIHKDNQIYCAYPDGLSAFGEPVNVVEKLFEVDLITSNPMYPTKRLHNVDGNNVIAFSSDLCEFIANGESKSAANETPMPQTAVPPANETSIPQTAIPPTNSGNSEFDPQNVSPSQVNKEEDSKNTKSESDILNDCVTRLIEMMKNQQGSWVNGIMKKHEGRIMVNVSCLNRISSDVNGLSQVKLLGACQRNPQIEVTRDFLITGADNET